MPVWDGYVVPGAISLAETAGRFCLRLPFNHAHRAATQRLAYLLRRSGAWFPSSPAELDICRDIKESVRYLHELLSLKVSHQRCCINSIMVDWLPGGIPQRRVQIAKTDKVHPSRRPTLAHWCRACGWARSDVCTPPLWKRGCGGCTDGH